MWISLLEVALLLVIVRVDQVMTPALLKAWFERRLLGSAQPMPAASDGADGEDKGRSTARPTIPVTPRSADFPPPARTRV